MHILFLTDNFPPEVNASSSRVFERAVYWVRWGHQVTIITCAPNFPEGQLFAGYKNRWYQQEEIQGIRVLRVKTFIAKNQGFLLRTLDFLSFMPMAICAGIFQSKPDVIVSTSPQFFTAVAGYLLSRLKRKPFIFELGDLWPASIVAVGAMKKSMTFTCLEKLELYLYRKSTKIVALTHAFKADLQSRGIDPSKINVIRNGVDLSRYSPRPKSTPLLQALGFEHKFVLGYIGTLGMAHGLDNLVLTAKQLAVDPSIQLMLVGTGAEKEKIAALVAKENISNLRLIPRQTKEVIADYWSLCDIALVHLKDSPIFSTVIPSKLFEAMGMGLPILLVSPPGEAADIIKTTQAGIWINANHPTQLAQTILQLKQDPAAIQQYRQQSQRASQYFTREEQSRQFVETLENARALQRPQQAPYQTPPSY